MRQEVRELVHQVDAQLVVVDADVDMQTADHHAPCGALHLLEERDVAFLVRALLAGGEREGMRRCGDGREAEATGCLDHGPAQLRELLPRFGDVAADRCCDFHLRTQELGEGTPRRLCIQLREELLGWFARHGPGLAVDEQVLLLDTEGQRRFARSHLASPDRSRRSAGSSSIGPISFARRRTQRSVPAGDSNWSWRISRQTYGNPADSAC